MGIIGQLEIQRVEIGVSGMAIAAILEQTFQLPGE
jgi:hypothetical protein